MDKIFITRILPDVKLINKLKEHFKVEVWEKSSPPTAKELLMKSKDCWGILTMLTERIDSDFIIKNQKLKIIANMAVGFDNIDIKAAKKQKIMVTNTPDVLTESTAELTFALLLLMAKRLPEANQAILNDQWGPWHPNWMLGKDLKNANLGIIGPGKIGNAVAKIAKSFSMKINYYGRKPKIDFPGNYMQLEKLLATSDYISIHLSLNSETNHFLNAKHFKKMKQDAILINTSRGKIINQDDLLQAIQRNEIGGAALDVTDPEPIDSSSPLLQMQNLFVSPHLGSATKATRYKMAAMAIDNLISYKIKNYCPNAII